MDGKWDIDVEFQVSLPAVSRLPGATVVVSRNMGNLPYKLGANSVAICWFFMT